MTSKIFKKALDNLVRLYGESPPLEILDRYYKEVSLIKNSDIPLLFSAIAKVKEESKKHGKRIWVKGSISSSFIAYLLGATDINPLPSHIFCRQCGKVTFTSEPISPLDTPKHTCECGEICPLDGYDLDFEICLNNIAAPTLEFHVAPSYFDTARDIAVDYLSCYKKCITKNDKYIGRIFLASKSSQEEQLPENELYSLPELVILRHFELELTDAIMERTNTSLENIAPSEAILSSLLNKDFDGVFRVERDKINGVIDKTKPKSYGDFLKILGLGCGGHIWENNLDIAFEEKNASLSSCPVFRDDVFKIVATKQKEHGIYSLGLASEVSRCASLGTYNLYGMNDLTKNALLSLGFDEGFISFLTKVVYMSQKADSIAYLMHIIILAWYKINYPDEFKEIIIDTKL